MRFPALAGRPTRKNRQFKLKSVERFKLHLGKMQNKPHLPIGLDYKKAITDYLREMGKIIIQTITGHWKIDFFTQVLILLTVIIFFLFVFFEIIL